MHTHSYIILYVYVCMYANTIVVQTPEENEDQLRPAKVLRRDPVGESAIASC